jgi:hypothetical protein
MFRSLLRKLTGISLLGRGAARRASAARRRKPAGLQIEALEAREVPTVSAFLSGGQLVVQGDYTGSTIRLSTDHQIGELPPFEQVSQRTSPTAPWQVVNQLFPVVLFNSIAVNATSDDVNVEGILKATTITSSARNTVNVSGLLTNTLTITNPPSYTTLNVDDSADPSAGTWSMDNAATTTGFGVIHGPGTDIFFKDADTAQVTLSTGTGGNTVNVLATGVTTNLVGHGRDTANIGYNATLQGIYGTLNISNPPSYTTINVNDSADAYARSWSVGNAATPGFGVIQDPFGVINYKYADTAQVTVWTGTGGNTVNVLAIADTTNLVGHGRDTVNIGNNGSLQGILGALNISNPPSYTTINVNDSADVGQHGTLSQATLNGDANWETLSGLTPYSYTRISYYDGDVSNIAIQLNSSSSLAVQSTGGVPTTVNGQPY